MNIKTIALFFGLLWLASTGYTQTLSETNRAVGVLAGVNFQNFNGKDFNGDKIENELIAGFHAGVNFQIPIAPEFYFQPGLLFSTKGSKNVSGTLSSTYRLSYIDLPLNLVYKGQVGTGYVLFGFGPYLSYAISGKATYVNGSVEVSNDIDFAKEVNLNDPLLATYFRPFDMGGNIFFGYEMTSGMFLQLNTQLGMVPINPKDNRIPSDDSIVKNTGFGLSLGYRF